ncbi:sugar ABC transporter ATP-binding protein [Paenibacillus glucanolyticus]|uniref:sugar ABC transporter ATP-binding protein n=1 Tax=Paenibacillus TaxID=44249 RepID=UPI0003E220CA|nr:MULTISPECIES: sugar ABC transporter ATP-binding protein [Paenibacillus]ANA82879.1 D-xylose ABC transporter ATP-binding protein [Paenibacillus glucanolyticus]AVV58034.1 sugar ABC transporter ATP-binding protein [Paenibacillus glucanolyticus]ETT42774.1 ABC transporter-like protein [Paenibacillus sp. FSL R5-808]MPY17907.1 sugar ABC transporter ATP-binding protein [Paenibacillus glucanolyticus]OMF83503.1 D-xylose ABC transporter ATP-binding protein [Paenibacillus glucanolyticus]
MSEVLLQMEGITKEFPGVLALNNCQFELRRGEVHALMGENGAGKSTMMKILTGVYQKDEGTVTYQGKPVELTNPKAAQDAGISMIHQELNLAPDLTVAQNIFIGREPRRRLRLFLDDQALHRQVKALFQRMGLDMDPAIQVSELTVAKQQMVEIAKALSYNADVLVMDEPTAALSETEIEDLFRIIRQLRADGVGIVYISHRMDEIKRITDRITVMRDGQYIDTVLTAEVTTQDIISKMVGRQIYETSKPEAAAGERETVLEVKGLNQGRALRDISFTLRKGEILGIAGLVGAGRTELARAIFGADRIQSGEIYIHGSRVKMRGPHDAVRLGIGYLSEDRKRYGCVVDLDVKSNVVIASYPGFLRPGGWVNTVKIRKQAEDMVERLKVKTPHVDQEVKFLSGGNQQKVVIGKWLTRDCDILIFDEPTRGIDVGAKSEIYRLLNELAAQGKSIIMISSELPEILRMSHRILVMCEGRITGELDHEEATQETIMHLATARM